MNDYQKGITYLTLVVLSFPTMGICILNGKPFLGAVLLLGINAGCWLWIFLDSYVYWKKEGYNYLTGEFKK